MINDVRSSAGTVMTSNFPSQFHRFCTIWTRWHQSIWPMRYHMISLPFEYLLIIWTKLFQFSAVADKISWGEDWWQYVIEANDPWADGTAGQAGRWGEVVKKRIKVLNKESSSDYYADKTCVSSLTHICLNTMANRALHNALLVSMTN